MSDEQDTQETPRAAAAFAEYCALGPARSLRKLAEKWGKSGAYVGQLERWSSVYKWVERVKQYDAERIAERVARKLAKREEMEDRHAKDAQEEQDLARKVIKQVVNAKGEITGRISLAAVQLLKNSREDERKALVEEEMPSLSQGAAIVGIAIYLPQKQSLKGDNANGHSES